MSGNILGQFKVVNIRSTTLWHVLSGKNISWWHECNIHFFILEGG